MKKGSIVHILLLAVLLILAGFPTGVSHAQEITTVLPDQLGVAVGVHLRPSQTYGADLQSYNTQAGKNAAILMYFTSFYYGLDDYLFQKIDSLPSTEKPVIMLTVLPYDGRQSSGCDRDYSGFIGYDNLIAGKCDGFIQKFAQDVSSKTGARFLIRFAHEMNIADSPYWPGNQGKSPADYINLYRHFADVFRAAQQAAGNRNAEFVWSPNYFSQPADEWNYFYHYYPGNSYVDWIGLSGYNWYPANGEPNRSFKQIYGDLDGTDAYYSDAGMLPGVLYDLSCRYAKPIILAEFGALHNDSTVAQKVSWITDAYSKIPNHPFVRAVVWFNDFAYGGSSMDIRVLKAGNTVSQSVPSEITSAYRNAIQSSAYRSALPSLADATPPATYCWTDADKAGKPVFSLSTRRILATRNSNANVTLTGMLVQDTPAISFYGTTPSLSASVSQDHLVAPWGDASLSFYTGSNASLGSYTVTVRVASQSTVTDLPVEVMVVDKIYKVNLPTVIGPN